MRRLATILPNELVAIILIVCVSMCCCQTHFLVHGLSGNGQDSAACSISAAPACCSGCASDRGTQTPNDGEQPGPSGDGCKICCVKGTGAKDICTAVPPLALASIPMLHVQLLLTPAPAAFKTTTAINELPPRVQPPTLVDLRCALLV